MCAGLRLASKKNELQAATTANQILHTVRQYVEKGSPWKKDLQCDVLPRFLARSELPFMEDLLLRGDRVVIPASLTRKVIALAHKSDPGIVRIKQRLRELHWWTGMNNYSGKRRKEL